MVSKTKAPKHKQNISLSQQVGIEREASETQRPFAKASIFAGLGVAAASYWQARFGTPMPDMPWPTPPWYLNPFGIAANLQGTLENTLKGVITMYKGVTEYPEIAAGTAALAAGADFEKNRRSTGDTQLKGQQVQPGHSPKSVNGTPRQGGRKPR